VTREARKKHMPVLSKFYGIVIRMLFKPGFGAHVHALYHDSELLVAVAPARVITGEAPPWVRELVLHWVEEHQTELMDNWFRCGHAIRPVAVAPALA
jgi:hypothetical protein